MNKDAGKLNVKQEHLNFEIEEIEIKEEIESSEENVNKEDPLEGNFNHEWQVGDEMPDVSMGKELPGLHYENETEDNVGNHSVKQENPVIGEEMKRIMPNTSGINQKLKHKRLHMANKYEKVKRGKIRLNTRTGELDEEQVIYNVAVFSGDTSDFDQSDDEVDEISLSNNDERDRDSQDMVEILSEDNESDDSVPPLTLTEEYNDVIPAISNDQESAIMEQSANHDGLPKWAKTEPETMRTEYLDKSFSEPPSRELTPYGYFKMFFDDDIIQHISDQTNLYSVQKSVSNIQTTKDEIEQFIGQLLFMGIIPLPQYRMYWHPSTRQPLVTEALQGGVNRFETIKRYFHINDNSTQPAVTSPNRDKLYKVRPLINSILSKCEQLQQEESSSVDDQIIPTTCRSHLKQYNPKKPNKWGFKVFTRCGLSGIIYQFEIYTGKTSDKERTTSSSLGPTGDLVLRLCSNIPKHLNFKVYFDNFFTSIDLLKRLRDDGIFSLGTIRANRLKGAQTLLQNEKKLKALPRGTSDWRTDISSNIVVVRWHDNRIVQLVSTFVGPENGEMTKRWSAKEKKVVHIECPEMVHKYNKHIGGVDLNDMLMSLYRIKLGTHKWYMHIVYYCIQVAVVNGWLLYRRHLSYLLSRNKKPMSLLDFQRMISEGLIKAGKLPPSLTTHEIPSLSPSGNPKKKQRNNVSNPLPCSDSRYDKIGHFAVYEEKQNRCRLCKNGYTYCKCIKCNTFLCSFKTRNCFYSFHVNN